MRSRRFVYSFRLLMILYNGDTFSLLHFFILSDLEQFLEGLKKICRKYYRKRGLNFEKELNTVFFAGARYHDKLTLEIWVGMTFKKFTFKNFTRTA